MRTLIVSNGPRQSIGTITQSGCRSEYAVEMGPHQRLIAIISDRQSVTDNGNQPVQVLGGRLALNHSLRALIISA
jgi:hypothetical protein